MTGHLSASLGVWLLIAATQIAGERYGFEPEFTEAMSNVTVPMGRDAVFTCSVANLGGHRVGWVKADTKAIQALHLAVVTLNPRVSVDHVGTTLWKLIIKNVQKEDAGAYMAQINTDPMKFQVAYLDVTEPPDIIDERTPGEVRVRENEPLKLTCEARGNPAPRITWKREDGLDLYISPRDDPATQSSAKGNRTTKNHQQHVALVVQQQQHSFDGEILRITQVSKRHMGIYYCIASNGVPPPVSKRVAVTVLFAPVVAVDNQIVGVPLGTNVTLGCIVESSPKSINVWYKDDKMIANSSRLSYEERGEWPSYRVRMILTIGYLRKTDVGRYDCRCRNELGEAEGTIKLHDLKPLATTTTTTTSTPEPIFILDDNDVYPMAEVTTQRPMRSASVTVRHHRQPVGIGEQAEALPADNGEHQQQQHSRGTMRPRHDRASSALAVGASASSIVSSLILARAIRLSWL